MKLAYDNYYQQENYFGAPYPELVDFFKQQKKDSKILDLGCGQGRDSIPIARLGFSVVGIDNSKVGIDQLNKLANKEGLQLKGIVSDIYEFTDFKKHDIILLDSMFHFSKKDKKKEVDFLKKIIELSSVKTIFVICIQDSGSKVKILKDVISGNKELDTISEASLFYEFKDIETNHSSKTKYRMIVIKKKGVT